MVDDWITHTPKSVLAKNFGLNESVFNSVPSPNPYIQNGTVSTRNVTSGPAGTLNGNASFIYRTLQHPAEKVPGGGGEFRKIDSTNFPISKTIAATFVTLKPGGLRELHWHPNVSAVESYPRRWNAYAVSRLRSGSTSMRVMPGLLFSLVVPTHALLISLLVIPLRSPTTLGSLTPLPSP